MGSFGARDAIFPLTLRLEFIEPSTTIVYESSLLAQVEEVSPTLAGSYRSQAFTHLHIH